MISHDQLKLMKPTGILMNTARASLVDGHALYLALANASIEGAAFDGYYEEPVPSPQEDKYGLLRLADDKFILSQHIGASTFDVQELMYTMAVKSVISFFGDSPIRHLVNPEYAKCASGLLGRKANGN